MIRLFQNRLFKLMAFTVYKTYSEHNLTWDVVLYNSFSCALELSWANCCIQKFSIYVMHHRVYIWLWLANKVVISNTVWQFIGKSQETHSIFLYFIIAWLYPIGKQLNCIMHDHKMWLTLKRSLRKCKTVRFYLGHK